MKSTVDQIRDRFDNEVERFSNLETGQAATIDAPLVMTLVTQAASAINPQATRILDIGCGAGNYTLKLLERISNPDVSLLDLSGAMLERARERLVGKTTGQIELLQQDVRDADLGVERFDVVMSAAALHHLREDAEWEAVFAKVWRSLKPGGSFWIADLIEHSDPRVQELMWRRYGEYLTALNGEEYRDKVYAYIAQEDTPRPLIFQLDLLRRVGFAQLEVLHKNSCFAAFGGVKA